MRQETDQNRVQGKFNHYCGLNLDLTPPSAMRTRGIKRQMDQMQVIFGNRRASPMVTGQIYQDENISRLGQSHKLSPGVSNSQQSERLPRPASISLSSLCCSSSSTAQSCPVLHRRLSFPENTQGKFSYLQPVGDELVAQPDGVFLASCTQSECCLD